MSIETSWQHNYSIYHNNNFTQTDVYDDVFNNTSQCSSLFGIGDSLYDFDLADRPQSARPTECGQEVPNGIQSEVEH